MSYPSASIEDPDIPDITMKVSGFTIIRNGVIYGYPFKESILSILPLCDEFIINVGGSEDSTLEEIKLLQSQYPEKIKLFESEWDDTIREGGKMLSVETNKAMEQCTGDWLFYLQGDEVLHEKYTGIVQKQMEQNLNDPEVDGLRFWYIHFYGSYEYIQDNYRKWYVKEIRLIKNHRNIVSAGDALSFEYKEGGKIKMKQIEAWIYHYGWVKPAETMLLKRKGFEKLYNNEDEYKKVVGKLTSYNDYGDLILFNGTHPEVMKEIVSSAELNFDPRFEEQKPDWVRKILIFLDPVIKRITRRNN
ncbi:hypothetical protein BH10BAC5_BH10BAC5_04240 [soil metagenome]